MESIEREGKTRLARAFNREMPDRPPILGGWLAAPEYVQSLTGCSEDQYWSDPFYWGLEAKRVLGSDAGARGDRGSRRRATRRSTSRTE